MTSLFSRLMPRKKPAWQIVAPLVLVLFLAVGWSVYWMTASTRAMEVVDQVLAREKARGLEISCADRSIGGYPFKFLLDCTELKIIRQTSSGQITLTASRLVTVVRAYDFNHIIGELYGPYELTTGQIRVTDGKIVDVRKLFSGNAGTVTSSLILQDQVLKETTVVIRDLSGTLVDYSSQSAPQDIATDLKEAVINIRTTSDVSQPIGDYEVVGVVKNLFLVGGSANFQSNKGARLDDVRMRVKLSDAPYQLTGKALDWLKAWKANDGEAQVTEFNATSGALKLKGKGQFKLDYLGRVQGVLKTKMIGLDVVVKELVANGKIREKDAELGLAAISLLGNAGADGVKISLQARKGKVYFGPFKIANLKPLFDQ